MGRIRTRRADVGLPGNGGQFAETTYAEADGGVTFLEDTDSFAPPMPRRRKPRTRPAPTPTPHPVPPPSDETAPEPVILREVIEPAAPGSEPVSRERIEAVLRATRERGGMYSEAELREVGAEVAARAEHLAGISAEDIRASSRARAEAAASAFTEANDAVGEYNIEVKAEMDRLAAQGLGRQEIFDGIMHHIPKGERLQKEAQSASRQKTYTEHGIDEETMSDLRRLSDGYTQALAETRSMGTKTQKYAEGSDPKARARIDEATSVYPDDWVEASNAEDARPMVAVNKRGRAAYTHEGSPMVVGGKKHRGMLVRQGQASMLVSPSKNAVITGRSSGFETAVHEYGHRSQYVVDGLAQAENDFLDSRVDRSRHVWAAGREACYADGGFVHDYVGRDYSHMDEQPSGGQVTEVTTVGMESMFGGSFGGLIGAGTKYRADEGHRNFVLGALAVIGRR